MIPGAVLVRTEQVTALPRGGLVGRLRALSFTRPWTTLILTGHKPIENRGWRPPTDLLGEWMVVHGAKSYDPGALDLAADLLAVPLDDWPSLSNELSPTGYLGIVCVTGYCATLPGYECACGPWAFDGQVHWHVSHPLVFDAPIPGPGRLGLWPAPDSVVDAANELLYREDS